MSISVRWTLSMLVQHQTLRYNVQHIHVCITVDLGRAWIPALDLQKVSCLYVQWISLYFIGWATDISNLSVWSLFATKLG